MAPEGAKVERVAVTPDGPRSPLHASPAIRYGDYLFVSGQLATDWIDARPAETLLPHAGDSTRAEVRRVFANLDAVVAAAGMSLDELARVDNYYGHRAVANGHFAARDEFYPGTPESKPASTAVGTAAYPAEGATYAIDAIGVRGARHGIFSDAVPTSPARLPMGVRCGPFAFLSGRMASDYRAGLAPEALTSAEWMWMGSPIRSETDYILGMYKEILASDGLSLQDVVKAEVFLRDPIDVTQLDEAWAEWFPENPPARSLFTVDDFAIPAARIEINVIALDPTAGLARRTISADGVPEPLFHEPHAVQAGPLLFLSTCLAHDDQGLAPAARPRPGFPWLGAPGRLETELILERVGRVCAAAGSSLAHVAKIQTHLRDMAQLDAFNEVLKREFPQSPPAWNVVGMDARPLIAGAQVMCDVIAIVPEALG
ncbi:MAG: RidA family protein [Actinobacteria bacterium]|nr:RidA family protein [Actinomycetota bacterium]